jgi:glycosyltransferase involved in cell wall biosynthesis
LAQAAKEAGFDVVVVTRVRDHGEVIRRAGLRLVPCEWSRRGLNPFRELLVLANLWRIYRREQPDIVHQVALKPVLYGALAAWFTGCGKVVNALAGLGFIFVSGRKRARLLRPLVRVALRWLLDRPGSRLVLQNRDDVEQFTQEKLADPKKIILIRGSGVDLARFAPVLEPPGPLVVMLASRLLWDKGVGEFVEAARRLRNQGATARFVLVGDGDSENPATIPRRQLDAWKEAGDIEWWGRRDDMPQTLGMAHIVCLPSYREGLPKVLLEAAAIERPMVATDVPGCREIVRPGENGILVPVRDAGALAAAIEKMLRDKAMRRRMGKAGRMLVEKEFAQEIVITRTLRLYQEMMA